ncbi:hypothetical protein NV379_22435 [Paenibacillus sp. N1-5-1-14]|uniref:hypothetical protein n=1 Tax=Paenibacillus radicibacter TaxID=2972488 RepID=UPI002159783D|nr:hypothetical protein [Paenibacillus radicibacter]MCR8645399.1 hypothetical protein [Paenibacillus radicibacter]
MAIKGIKMSDESLEIVNKRIEASGMDAGEWLESLMAIESIKEIKKHNTPIESDLEDFEKHMNRVYHILIRLYQRGADALEEVKEQSLEEQARGEAKAEAIKTELSTVQKHLKQKEEELAASQLSNTEMRVKLEQLEKTTKAVEELYRLTMEKMEMLQGKLDKLQDAEKVVVETKEQMQEMNQAHAYEIAQKKEGETKLVQSLNDMQKELDRRQKQFDEELNSMKSNHVREMEVLRKDLEMKAKETLLEVKEESQSKINQINEQNASKMAELVNMMQGKAKD